MSISELLNILNVQNKNLSDLLVFVQEKQYCLVHSDNSNLIISMNKEEKMLFKIQKTEENRLQIMKTIFEQNDIRNDRFKLSILIEELKGKVNESILKAVGKLEKEMKSKILEIGKINQQNMLLIKQSRQIINETIQAVVNLSNRSIVDRKG